MKKLVMVILSALLFCSCSSYYCYVTSLGENPEQKSYYLEPANIEMANDLEYRAYSKDVANMLGNLGYEMVSKENANIRIVFFYSIGGIQNEDHVGHTTTYVSTPHTTTTYYNGRASSYTTYTSTPITSSYAYSTEYQSVCVVLTAFSAVSNEPIWKVAITDRIDLGRTTLKKMMPWMLTLAQPYVGTEANGRPTITREQGSYLGLTWPY